MPDVDAKAKIAVAQHFFSDVDEDGEALERYAYWQSAESFDEVEGLGEVWEPFADWLPESVWNAMEAMQENLVRLFGEE